MAAIGVLALQGAYQKHAILFAEIGCDVFLVRKPKDLEHIDALVIPGGESTVMQRQIDFIQMREPLSQFAAVKPLFGTCAGAILMSKRVMGDKMMPFGLIDMDIERNGYGRQLESFSEEIALKGKRARVHGVFIRAPRIVRVGEGVEVLAEREGEPLLVREGKHMAATFHPELVGDVAIHREFLKSL